MVKPKVIRVRAKMKGTPVPMVLWASNEERVNRGNGDDDVFQTACEAVVQIAKTAGNNAEYEGHGKFGGVKVPNKGGGDEYAGEDG